MAEWNLNVEKQLGINREPEHAILVGLITNNVTERLAIEYLEELEFLAETAGAKTVKKFTQRLPNPDPRTFIGSGKLEEIKLYIETSKVTLVIFDDDLTGKQTNIIEEELKVKILDRSTLILDIFATRAQSAQAKTQVELAQMQYLLPRLRGLWTHLERQRGGIGMRGPGEKEIETDRRIVRDKISMLKDKLEKIDLQNSTQRKTRGELIRVALVGYTNVGKSTTMNLLSKSDVFAENKLFATLDTTVRKVVFTSIPFLLSDTVGFIRKLPHHLVESFKSTLDEVRESDIIIHVVDISHPQYHDQIETVNATLKDLKADGKPTIYLFNKIDAYREINYDLLLDKEVEAQIEQELVTHLKNTYGTNILFSAMTKENLDDFKVMLETLVIENYKIRYPFKSIDYWK